MFRDPVRFAHEVPTAQWTALNAPETGRSYLTYSPSTLLELFSSASFVVKLYCFRYLDAVVACDRCV